MAESYHVGGPVYVQTGTGTADAFETLGMSESGADVREDYLTSFQKSDIAGEAPADVLTRGATAEISITLSSWDDAVLTRVKNRSKGAAGNATEGTVGPPGTLLGTTANRAFKLYLPSSTDAPYRWATAILRNPNARISTDYGKLNLTFFAWIFIAAGTTAFGTPILTYRSAP